MNRTDYLTRAREFAFRGNDLAHAKLDDDKVRSIRANQERLTQAEWAARLGVSKRAIEKVNAYETWAHVA